MEAPVREDHEYPDMVADTDQATYRIAALLGEGGQGAVFRTRDNNVAVKLMFEKDVSVARDLQARMVQMEARPLWNWNPTPPRKSPRPIRSCSSTCITLTSGRRLGSMRLSIRPRSRVLSESFTPSSAAR